MKPHTRRAVAFVVALLRGHNPSSVYDFGESKFFSFSGELASNDVSAHDFEQSAGITGSGTSFYHHGNRAHMDITVNGGDFEGYDHDSRNHFSGTFSDGSISLYDFGVSGFFNFSV